MRAPVQLGLVFLAALAVLGIFVAPSGAVDVYIVLALIVLLVAYQLLDARLSPARRARVGLFMLGGAIAFVAIVVERVRRILEA